MIYFTSDLHPGHNAVINMQNRPFEDERFFDIFGALCVCGP